MKEQHIRYSSKMTNKLKEEDPNLLKTKEKWEKWMGKEVEITTIDTNVVIVKPK